MITTATRRGKAWLSRASFLMGRTPRVESRADFRRFIPAPFRSVLLISADFELAWGPRYAKSAGDPLAFALQKARQERANISPILALTEKYGIPITWAAVGHLFLDSCRPAGGKKHAEIPKVPTYKGPFWDFSGDDWFEHDPCADYRSRPEWYAPDLIRLILDSPAGHEIGCHTFSHIDCRDAACPPELLKAELRACKALASQWGLTLRSFVHPGHTIGNLDVLKAEGFTSFRTDYRNVLGYPKRHDSGLWEFEQTAEFAFRKEWPASYHASRYIRILKRAIASNTVCVCWFHPSFDPIIVEKVWPEVFRFLDNHRDEIWIGTHQAYVDFLEQHHWL